MKDFLSFILIIVITVVVLMTHAKMDWFFYEGNKKFLPVMLVGLLMLGGWLAGRLVDKIHLPKISGYLIFGILIGPYIPWDGFLQVISFGYWEIESQGFHIIPNQPQTNGTPDSLLQLKFAKDLAISLIAITAGGEIQLAWLKGRVMRVMIMTTCLVLVVALLIAAAAVGLQTVTGFLMPSDTGWVSILFLCGFLGLILAGNSPSVTIAMITESHAKGPLSSNALLLTVCKDLLIVVAFATVLALSRGVLSPDAKLSAGFLVVVSAELLGSILCGVLLGILMGIVSKQLQRHHVIFIVASCFFFALIAEQTISFSLGGEQFSFHLEVLLLALSAGLTMRNMMPESTSKLFHEIEEMSLPVYCLFFAVVGAGMEIAIFYEMIVAVLIVVVLRVAAIYLVSRFVVKMASPDGEREPWHRWFWMTMLPQAGVTLALVTLMKQGLGPLNLAWVDTLYRLILGLVLVHALLGPILFRVALQKSDEVNKAHFHD